MLFRKSSRASRGPAASVLLLLLVAILTAAVDFVPEPASAQGAPPGILAPGNAAVTGFSGARLPAEVPAGVEAGEQAFIDLDGPSARIIDLSNMQGTPAAQLVPARKPFTLTAAQLGQVFGVALDNAVPPNIYLAATSSYGLPIVAQTSDGKLLHLKTGGPAAFFMPGAMGSAGSEWRYRFDLEGRRCNWCCDAVRQCRAPESSEFGTSAWWTCVRSAVGVATCRQ